MENRQEKLGGKKTAKNSDEKNGYIVDQLRDVLNGYTVDQLREVLLKNFAKK